MIHRLLSSLGLCRKAGKLVMGFDAVVDQGKAGGLYFIAAARDLSEKSLKNLRYELSQYSIPICTIPLAMDDIAPVVGRRSGILGITDPNLAKAVQTALTRYHEEE